MKGIKAECPRCKNSELYAVEYVPSTSYDVNVTPEGIFILGKEMPITASKIFHILCETCDFSYVYEGNDTEHTAKDSEGNTIIESLTRDYPGLRDPLSITLHSDIGT